MNDAKWDTLAAKWVGVQIIWGDAEAGSLAAQGPGQRKRADFYRKQIMEEDDEIIALLQVFMQVLDD